MIAKYLNCNALISLFLYISFYRRFFVSSRYLFFYNFLSATYFYFVTTRSSLLLSLMIFLPFVDASCFTFRAEYNFACCLLSSFYSVHSIAIFLLYNVIVITITRLTHGFSVPFSHLFFRLYFPYFLFPSPCSFLIFHRNLSAAFILPLLSCLISLFFPSYLIPLLFSFNLSSLVHFLFYTLLLGLIFPLKSFVYSLILIILSYCFLSLCEFNVAAFSFFCLSIF